jgi:hypothetical protein
LNSQAVKRAILPCPDASKKGFAKGNKLEKKRVQAPDEAFETQANL